MAGGRPPDFPDGVIDGEDFAVHDGVVVEGALADSVVVGGPPDEVAGGGGGGLLPSAQG